MESNFKWHYSISRITVMLFVDYYFVRFSWLGLLYCLVIVRIEHQILFEWLTSCLSTPRSAVWRVQAVIDEGGFEVITREKKWPKIAVHLCYQASKNIGSTLRQHCEKILYPFDVFMAGATTDAKVSQRMYCITNVGLQRMVFFIVWLCFCLYS